MLDDASFGYWLAVRRKALHLSVVELARRVGCATVTLHKLEADMRRPSREFAGKLAEHLAVAPAERERFVRVARGELCADRLSAPDQLVIVPAQRGRVARSTDLPLPPTTLIGRAPDIAAICALLWRTDVRLLTLIGAPGIGKTRLALAVAADVANIQNGDRYPDGVFVVSLGSIREPNLVIPTIAQAIGLSADASQPVLERLQTYLHDRQLLLVLDNFEHVWQAAPHVAALLEQAPQLTLLVTSRVALQLSREQRYIVQPLALPDIPHLATTIDRTAALMQFAAVELFVTRAVTASTRFALTDENALAIATLCVHLDGLPLALELAAARMGLFTPQELLEHPDHRLALLTEGAIDIPVRQQTLQRAIAWSYDLLDAPEQALFRRLGVFVDGCTLTAAEQVCNTANDLGIPVLNGITALIQKSLLQREELADGRSRLRMLETIREYAFGHLEQSGEAARIRTAHAHFFMALAERAEPHLYGAGQREWVRRLATEYANVRAALGWSIEHADDIGLRLAGALGWFWHLHGDHREGRTWLLKALGCANDADSSLDRWRAKALNQAGYLAMWQHDLVDAHALLEQSVALWHSVDDQCGLAHALLDWGGCVSREGDLLRSRALLEESITVFRHIDEKQGLVRALLWHGGITVRQGDVATARKSADECIRLGREVGDTSNIAAAMGAILAHIAVLQGDLPGAHSLQETHLRLMREADDTPGIAHALGFLGSLAYLQGRYVQAKPLLEERLQIWSALGNRQYIAWSRYALGYVALRQNDWQSATELFTESLALWRESGSMQGVARCFAGMAEVAQATGQPEQAAQLLAATQVVSAASGSQWRDAELDPAAGYPITSQADVDRLVGIVRAALGEDSFEMAWATGQSMSVAEAVSATMSLLTRTPRIASASTSPRLMRSNWPDQAKPK